MMSFFLAEAMELCNDDYTISLCFYESCYFHWLCDDNVIILVPALCPFVNEHKSIVNDVFVSYNLLGDILLSTPHCQ